MSATDRPGLTRSGPLPPILPDQAALDHYQAWQAEQRAIRQHGRRPPTVSELSVGSLIPAAHDHTEKGNDDNRWIRKRSSLPFAPRPLGHALRMALKRGAEPDLDTVWNSPLLSRARAAQECFAELPFSLHYQTSSRTDTVLNGVIDLAFLENGAWVIVGLKDDVLSDGQAEPRAGRYHSELSVYALALERLSAYPVQDLVVLFARSATDVHLAWNDRARADAQTLLDQTRPRPER